MKKYIVWLILCLSVVGHAEHDAMTTTEAVSLGVVQGITEYLPVSSTGHLILFDELYSAKDGLSCDNYSVITDRVTKSAKDAYFVVIQFGSILAVLLLYRQRCYSIVTGVFGRSRCGRSLCCNLLLSFFPSAVVGLCVDGWLQSRLYNKYAIACALFVGAIMMLLAERHYSRNSRKRKQMTSISTMTPYKSITIGLLQCLALIPGMSRSMTTILGGYCVGLKRTDAAEYSFLLGLVTLSAATVYKLIFNFSDLFAVINVSQFFIGIIVAFVFSVIAIRFLIRFLSKNGMSLFAYYRVVLAVIILLFL